MESKTAIKDISGNESNPVLARIEVLKQERKNVSDSIQQHRNAIKSAEQEARKLHTEQKQLEVSLMDRSKIVDELKIVIQKYNVEDPYTMKKQVHRIFSTGEVHYSRCLYREKWRFFIGPVVNYHNPELSDLFQNTISKHKYIYTTNNGVLEIRDILKKIYMIDTYKK